MCDVSPPNQVKNLPDFICQPTRVSDRVSNIYSKQSDHHEQALIEYQSKIKNVNSNIENRIQYRCQAAAKKLADVYGFIRDNHISSLRDQKKYSSVDQFREIWVYIQRDMLEASVIIDQLEHDLLMSCEHVRINKIKRIMSEQFEVILDCGRWSEAKLVSFLDSESQRLNMLSIQNYRLYFSLTGNLRVKSVETLKKYKEEWDKLLMTWRDYLVRENLIIIKNMVNSKEYSDPVQVAESKQECVDELQRLDGKIMEMFGDVVKGLPYNKSMLVNFSRSVENILDNKDHIRTRFMERSRAHFHMLIDKLEKRLLSMKEFLSKEASCDDEQFLKTFSKYVGQGCESFEVKCEQLMEKYNTEISGNLSVMVDVFSYAMQFLNGVCDLWENNLCSVTTHKATMTSELGTIRSEHQSDVKILEYSVDKSMEKLPQTPDVGQVNRLLERIMTHMKKIQEGTKQAFKSYNEVLEAYPTTCQDQIREYTKEVLQFIGLQLVRKKARKSLTSTNSKFLEINGHQYFKLDQIPGFFDQDSSHTDGVVKTKFYTIVEQAREFLIGHINSHEKKHREETDSLVTKLRLEMEREMDLRKSFVAPRKQNIRDSFSLRKEELTQFKDSFDLFYQNTQLFEKELCRLEEDLNVESLEFLRTTEQRVKDECDKQLKQTRSKKLIEAHETFEKVMFDIENRLPEISKTSIANVDKAAKQMKQNEDSFVRFAENGNYNFGVKSRFHFEFCELREKAKTLTTQTKRTIKQFEGIRVKKLTSVTQTYKIHYKHCLLGLYFSEMRSCHLSRTRLKLKSVLSHGEKDLMIVNDKTKEVKDIISSITECTMAEVPEKSEQVMVSFTDLFAKLKSTINFFNHRCSSITVPHKSSLAEIKQKYDNFGRNDASLCETVSFTQEIVSITSVKPLTIPSGSEEDLEAKEHNWVIDRHEVDRKYIQGRISCVYGIGANILDIPNNPWAGVCATLTSTPNSYWLSKNADGLQALKELKEKKEKIFEQQDNPEKEMVRRKSTKSESTAPPVNKNWNTLKMVLIPENDEINVEKTKSILPAIDPNILKDKRKDSTKQWNMEAAMKVTKTAKILTTEAINKKKRSTFFKSQVKVKIYDFLTMDESELKGIVFEPAAFFNLDKRNYKVDQVCESIDSVTEKTKFLLFHLQEDFVISCIIFYRQKHMNIKYPDRVQPNLDSAVNSFVKTTKGYLDRINSSCSENIARIKSFLKKIYTTLKEMPKVFFSHVLTQSSNNFILFYQHHLEEHTTLISGNKEDKRILFHRLTPSLEHPQRAEELAELCESELKSRISGTITELYNSGVSHMEELRERFVATIEATATDMLSVCESVIQVEDIRKVGSTEANSLEVKKRLRQNQINLNTVTNEGNYNSVLQAFSRMNGTQHKMKSSVLEAKTSAIKDFETLFSNIISEYTELFKNSVKEERDWVFKWEKCLMEVRDGQVYSKELL